MTVLAPEIMRAADRGAGSGFDVFSRPRRLWSPVCDATSNGFGKAYVRTGPETIQNRLETRI